MIVSIGMLAYNEAAGISRTIQSLLAQSAFHDRAPESGVSEWEIVVVPNGCSDSTALVANEALQTAVAGLSALKISHSVRVIDQGGKSNAWNHYVHGMARADADVMILVDSDIEFGHLDTIVNCLVELQTNLHAKVVVDLPLKDFLKKDRLSWIERLSAKNSSIQLASGIGIAGSFYCAAASTLRQVWMPPGLSGEDGFLKGMIVTDFFRSEPDARRVARARDASHYYEGLTSVKDIFHHELRMVIGTALNCYFMWDFLKFATDPSGPGAGALIRSQLAADPSWYRRTIENQIRNRGLFALPRGTLLQRFAALRGLTWLQVLRRLPLVVAGTLLDVPTFWLANRKLRSGKAIGFW